MITCGYSPNTDALINYLLGIDETVEFVDVDPNDIQFIKIKKDLSSKLYMVIFHDLNGKKHINAVGEDEWPFNVRMRDMKGGILVTNLDTDIKYVVIKSRTNCKILEKTAYESMNKK